MDIFAIIGIVFTAASAIATITPSKTDDKFMSKVGRAFDIIGFNPIKIFKK